MNLKNWFRKLTTSESTERVVEKTITEVVTNEIPVTKIEKVTEEIPINRIEKVTEEIPVERVKQVEVQVPIDRIVQVEKQVPVPKITEIVREVPVDKIQTVIKEITVDKIHTVDKEIPITKVEFHTNEVPITKIVEIEKEIPVDKIIQVEKEIPVDKVQIVEVEKPIFDTKVKSTLNTINDQIENVMGLRDLFKSKSNDFTEKYEILSKSIEDLERSVEQLNGADFNTKIEVLYNKLDAVNEFLSKLKVRKSLEVDNTQLNKELQDAQDELYTLQLKYKSLEESFNKVSQQKQLLEEQKANLSNLQDLEIVRERYFQLLEFAFHNVDPYAPFDPAEARFYWENAIKK